MAEDPKQIEDGLKSIYEEPDGEMPDLSSLERSRGSRLRRVLVGSTVLIAVLSGAAWGGFLLWSRIPFLGAPPETLVAQFEGPTRIEAGEEIFFTVRYRNAGTVPLAALEFDLSLPAGFEMTGSNPPPSDGLTWRIGSVTAGSDGEIAISGVFRSEVDSTQTLQGLFRYRPANFSSDFERIESHRVTVADSVLDIDASGPEKALAGDEVEYVVNVRNDGSVPVRSVLVSADIPEDFSLVSSDPEPTAADRAEWLIESLDPGELAAVTVRGQYTSAAAGGQTIAFRTGLLEEGGVVLAQNRDDALTDVLGGTVSFSLIVDGGSEDIHAELGEGLLISIDYENAGSEAVEGLVFTLTLDSEQGGTVPIDWSRIELEEGVRRSSGSQGVALAWHEGTRPEFAVLSPGEEGVIDLVLPILEEIDPSEHADAFSIDLTADLRKVGSVESPRSIEASPVRVEIDSDFRIAAEARYYDEEGQPLGSGPVPPKVGETTVYRVLWRVDNALHPLDGIRVTTNLPPDVSWVGDKETDIGTLEFDNTTRLVTWRVDRLPTDIRRAGAWFDLAITPDENDTGAFFKLTNATSGDAEDAVTGGHLSRALDILTTELPTDDHAEAGVVLE